MLRSLLLAALSLSIGLTLLTLPALAADDATREHVNRLFQERRWAEAQAIMEQVTAAEPENARAWHTLGLTHLARQDAAKAVPVLEKAVALAPQDAEMHLQLGHAYGLAAQKAGLFAKLGYANKCKAAYDQAVALDPANISVRWSLMEFCRQAPGFVGGGLPQAYAQAAAIKQLDPRRGRAAYASLYLGEKKYAEAFAVYDEVLRGLPDDRDSLFHVGRLAAVSGQQLDRGLAALRRLLTHPDRHSDARIHAHLGTILEKQGDKAGAQSAYEAAVAADPGFTAALESLRRLSES